MNSNAHRNPRVNRPMPMSASYSHAVAEAAAHARREHSVAPVPAGPVVRPRVVIGAVMLVLLGFLSSTLVLHAWAAGLDLEHRLLKSRFVATA